MKPYGILIEADDPLALRSHTEGGATFKTGKPVTFTYLHNNVSAAQHGSRFQQDIEPAGYYVNQFTQDPAKLPTKAEQKRSGIDWTVGEMTLRNPLVLAFNTGSGYYDDQSWKARLTDVFGAKGRKLSKKLMAAGYDGIVTVEKRRQGTYISEIVSLR